MKKAVILLVFFLMQSLYSMPKFDLEPVRGGYQIKLQIPAMLLEAIAVNNKLSDGTPVGETFTKFVIFNYFKEKNCIFKS